MPHTIIDHYLPAAIEDGDDIVFPVGEGFGLVCVLGSDDSLILVDGAFSSESEPDRLVYTFGASVDPAAGDTLIIAVQE